MRLTAIVVSHVHMTTKSIRYPEGVECVKRNLNMMLDVPCMLVSCDFTDYLAGLYEVCGNHKAKV